MTFTLEANRDVLTHVDLTADACPRNNRASRVGTRWHHGQGTRPGVARCRQKHAMGFRGFHPDTRRGIAAGNVQVTLGETAISPGRNVGVLSYYDPTTAQFLTPDPLFALTGSRYGYAGNDPVNGSDPTGLWCLVHNSSGGCMGGETVAHAANAALPVVHTVAAATSVVAGGCAVALAVTGVGGAVCGAVALTASAVTAVSGTALYLEGKESKTGAYLDSTGALLSAGGTLFDAGAAAADIASANAEGNAYLTELQRFGSPWYSRLGPWARGEMWSLEAGAWSGLSGLLGMGALGFGLGGLATGLAGYLPGTCS